MNWKNWRINIVLIFIFIFWATILARLVFLSILNHEFYKALAEGQQKILTPTIGERGEIFFQNGEPIAINKTGRYVFLCPNEVKEKEKTAEILAQILKIDKNEILEKTQKVSLFEPIKHRLSETEQKLLEEKNLPGVYLQDEVYRYYPQGNLFSHIIGFVSQDQKGNYGIEGYYGEILKGKEVLAEKEKGLSGFFGPFFFEQEGKGSDLVLALDSNIQFMADSLLSAYSEKLGFASGQILVLNPKSGEILALAAIPNFDPNNYSQIEDAEIFQNAITQKIFEPGSVFKPFTMATALDKKAITPQTTYVDKGKVQIGGWTVYNYDQRTWGKRTMVEVLERSINTGAVFAEQQVGHDIFLEYIEKFGFFEKTEVDLQGEVASENLEFKKGYEINFVTASFGQGIEITPIQLARAFSAIANGGKLIKPYVVAKITENGKETKPQSDSEEIQVISPETASQLTAMLVSVVENGSGRTTKIDGYFIAGKTGTAQVSWPALGIQKPGYSEKTIQTFVGFFPAFDPEFLILVKLDDPQVRTAEYSSALVFKDLAKYIINYKEIPPDYK